MDSPLLYLTLCSLRNRVSVRLRRLRQPRYLAGSVVGIAYFYWFLFRPRPPGRRNGPPSLAAAFAGGGVLIELGAATLLLLSVAVAWLWSWSKRPALAFSQAEVQFLFTAPIPRRGLVRYKILRTQLGTLIGSAIMTLFFRPTSLAGGWMFFIGLALVMAILSLHGTGVSLRSATLDQPGPMGSVRRWVPRAIAAAALVIVLGTLTAHWGDLLAIGARGGNVVSEIERLGTTGAAGVVLWPFRMIVRLPLAASPAAFFTAFPFALALLALIYVWVVRTDVAFEEASAELSEKLASIRSGRVIAPRAPKGAVATPFVLALEGPVELAILWKNLILMGRFLSWKMLIRVAPLLLMLVLFMSRGLRGETVNMLAFFCLMVAAFAVILGPQITRIDLRHDLASLAVLKTWPVRGAVLVRGEILAPALVLTVIVSLALTAAALLSTHAAFTMAVADRWGYLLAALLLAPGVILAQLLVQNALAVTFPSWVTIGTPQRGGVDVMGQRLLMMAANLLALVVVVLPAALVGSLAALAGYALIGTIPIVVPAVLAAGTLQVEAFVGSELIGVLLDRTDVSAIDPSEG